MATSEPIFYVVSDSIGETAELVVRAAAIQYNGGHVNIERVPYVTEPSHVMEILEEAAARKSVITFTMVKPELRKLIRDEADKRGIPWVDVLGPMMEAMGKVLAGQPKLQPGLVHQLDDEYFRKVEAIEFAVKYDDGKDPRGVLRADFTLIGVSRTSKTPVSMYLAQRRLKVANIPLVPEVPPPDELFQVPPHRVIGLTINPQQLNSIRKERLKTLGLSAQANYADLERILQELEYAESVMRKIGCPIIDVTNKAVEETAAKILEIVKKGEALHVR